MGNALNDYPDLIDKLDNLRYKIQEYMITTESATSTTVDMSKWIAKYSYSYPLDIDGRNRVWDYYVLEGLRCKYPLSFGGYVRFGKDV